MCQKTKLLHEKECRLCKNPTHLLYFRSVERCLVYYFAKCTKCNYSYRSNMTMSEWQEAQKQNVQLQQLTVHHRRCRSNGGSDNPENLSYVTEKKHQAWHLLFSNKTPAQIVQLLNDVWLPPDIKLFITKISKNEPAILMGNRRSSTSPN